MITLISGGARSGKSRYALELAEPYEHRVFIATAQAFDDEMRLRIQAHRAEREGLFQTMEAPIAPAQALSSLPSCGPGHNPGHSQVAVVDCLTVWLGNLMYQREQTGAALASDLESYDPIGNFLTILPALTVDLIVVTNEIGLGLVPDNPMGRAFRDLAGRLNQEVALRADRVVFMVCGLPLEVKPGTDRRSGP